jgi:hypothetical protein
MVFQILADATVVVHLAFVLFVVLGGLLVLWRPWIAWLHVPAAIWGAWIEFAGWICPLTPFENWLRRRGGGAGYSAGFVEQYLLPVLYPAALTRELQWVLGAIVIVINAAVYAIIFRNRGHVQGLPDHRRRRPDRG